MRRIMLRSDFYRIVGVGSKRGTIYPIPNVLTTLHLLRDGRWNVRAMEGFSLGVERAPQLYRVIFASHCPYKQPLTVARTAYILGMGSEAAGVSGETQSVAQHQKYFLLFA